MIMIEHVEDSDGDGAMAKGSSHALLFPAKSVPIDLHRDESAGQESERKISRVRKLSKRLSSTLRLSSIFTRDEGEQEKVKPASSQHRRTVHDKKHHSLLGRVFSLENFSSQHVHEMDPVHETLQPAVSTSDLSTYRHDAVRRVTSLPVAHPTASRAQGKTRNNRPVRQSAYSAPYGQIDQYQKLEKLGEGSYATVYKGISRVSNLFVAMKEIRLQEEEGLPFTAIREASLLKELKHVNIVRLHDIIPTKDHLVLVFEFLHTDLCQFLEERPFGVHPHNSKLLLFQLLRGLAFIHTRQILHRDIKPQNLLLSKRGELKLADFGLARAKSVPSHTYTHEVVTLWYRPPDVLLGSTDYTTSLDMWGVGCIFVEMISGFPLFPGVKSSTDQLTTIFKVLGTPTASTFPQLESSDFRPEDFPKYPGEPLSHQAPRLRVIPHGEDIANAMLRLNPKERISADDAMKHAYFRDLPSKIHKLEDTVSILDVKGVKMCDDPKRPESSKISYKAEHSGRYV